ncbi:MAG: hypothetical protein KatS3mg109_0310 [Pirellulaceae bacterium]|nr:MAG: hypothetical protein KatS3mg109_0310 [Pirellulaceae bacterium]GIW96520.1 MAG: hypothetical protein KatS3mg110_4561 [Pirellulaceae bacterium]
MPSGTSAGYTKHDEPVVREELFVGWSTPKLALVVTGRQNGYLEPCGCTGLSNQKGGLARRYTLLEQLRGRGWPLVPVDLGNQVRRFGRQPELQFQLTTEAMKQMGYAAVTFGPADLQLTSDELAATTAPADAHGPSFVSANVAILDRDFTPRYRLVEVAGVRVAVTGVLGDQYARELQAGDLVIEPALDGLRKAWQQIAEAGGCDVAVLLAHATRGETLELARAVPHFDIVVTAGGAETPPLEPEPLGQGRLLLWVGAKGMYAAVLGFFPEEAQRWRYQRVPLDSRFADARPMLDLMAVYQRQLERLGLEGLGLKPLPHPSGRQFVGSETCGDCHTKAYAVWKNTPHAHATDSIVHPTERSEIPRHFDPECLSCHVTGWNPQRFTPYASGYWSLESTPKMVGNGCENCHGPGSAHVEAEEGGASDELLEQLREEMRLVLAGAEKKCIECHDLDNSPDFHRPGAFEHYWQQIAHPGKD